MEALAFAGPVIGGLLGGDAAGDAADAQIAAGNARHDTGACFCDTSITIRASGRQVSGT